MIDIEELKRNLRALAEALPDVPARLSSLAEASESLRRSVDDLGKDLRDKQAEAEKALGEADRVLNELEAAASDQETRLREASTEMASGLRESLLPLAVDGAGMVPPELPMEALSEGPARLQGAQGEAEEAMTAIGAKLDAGQATLRSAAETLTASEGRLGARLEGAQTALAEGVDGVVRLMEACQQEALGRIDEMVQNFSGLQSSLQEKLEEVGETVCRARSEQALEETRTRVEEVQQRILTVLGELEGAVRGSGEQMRVAREGSVGDRESLDGLFQSLQAHLDPMNRAIESIRQAEAGLEA